MVNTSSHEENYSNNYTHFLSNIATSSSVDKYLRCMYNSNEVILSDEKNLDCILMNDYKIFGSIGIDFINALWDKVIVTWRCILVLLVRKKYPAIQKNVQTVV
jgi:hypothetical protein